MNAARRGRQLVDALRKCKPEELFLFQTSGEKYVLRMPNPTRLIGQRRSTRTDFQIRPCLLEGFSHGPGLLIQ